MQTKNLSYDSTEEQAEVLQKLMQLFFEKSEKTEIFTQGIKLVKELFHLESVVIYEYSRKKQIYEIVLKESKKRYKKLKNIKNNVYLRKGMKGVTHSIKADDSRLGLIIAKKKNGNHNIIRQHKSFFKNCISLIALAYIRKQQYQVECSKNAYIYNILERNPAAVVQLVFKHGKYVPISCND